MMHWFDWVTLGILVVVTVAHTIRGSRAGGMGLPMFEGLGLVVATVGATTLSGPLAGALSMQKSVVMIILFLVFAVLAFVVAHWLFSLTGWSMQSMDGFFSFVFGLVGAWAIANMVLRIILASQPMNGELAMHAADSLVVREVFQFRTWNALMRLLFRVKLGPEIDPDVG